MYKTPPINFHGILRSKKRWTIALNTGHKRVRVFRTRGEVLKQGAISDEGIHCVLKAAAHFGWAAAYCLLLGQQAVLLVVYRTFHPASLHITALALAD